MGRRKKLADSVFRFRENLYYGGVPKYTYLRRPVISRVVGGV